ncbi:MAG TPA: ATP-binding protein [Actinomycetota bacterium]|nr:ATP-binding protein [Actinomycetota bacterium]
MTRRAAWIAWGLLVLDLALLVAAIVLEFTVAEGDEDIQFLYGGFALVLGYGIAGGMIASRQPRNAIGWLLCSIATIFAITAFTDEFVSRQLMLGSETMLVPLAWLQTWLLVPGLVAVPLVLLLFPNGHPPSPRWRPLVWATVILAAMASLGFIVSPEPLEAPDRFFLANPTAIESLPGLSTFLLTVGGWGSLAVALASIASLVVRFRRSIGDERQQIRWLAYVGLTGVAVLIATMVFGDSGTLGDVLFFLLFLIVAAGIPAATGIAILKYRLYGFDLVIRRTLVFGVLAAIITAIYVGIVVAIPTVATDSLVPSLIATAIVAALFQPIRRRVVHLADRLVFGRRAEPYEVLARFSDRVGASYAAEDVIPRTARVIAEGTGATHVEIWLRAGEQTHLAAAWPGSDVPPSTPDVRPIGTPEQPLGEIRVWTAPGQPLRPTEEKLLADLASQTASVVQNLHLTSELRARVDELSALAEELRESRMRIVQAHDAERRRLERNIHDGAQQHLVALAVKLRLAGATAAKDPPQAAVQLRDLGVQTDVALTTLLDLAGGIYPAELEERGIGPALTTLGRSAGIPIDVDVDGVGRLPIEIEAAIYFVCLEAMQNAAKYAHATEVRVALEREDDTIAFSVRDDGVGFDAASTTSGSGLQNMRDRLAAFGGDVGISSTPGAGTTVSGRLEMPEVART